MKKLVNFAKIVFWSASLILMITLTIKDTMSDVITKQSRSSAEIISGITNQPVEVFIEPSTWTRLLFLSGITMFLAFWLLEINSVPVPKIKSNRYYRLEKTITQKGGARNCIKLRR